MSVKFMAQAVLNVYEARVKILKELSAHSATR